MSGTKDENNIEQQDSGTKDGKALIKYINVLPCVDDSDSFTDADESSFEEGKEQ